MYRVIIVDDDELIRKGLEKVIRWEQMGFSVEHTFQGAAEALDYVKDHPIDVILTDIRMPQMTGLELIQAAKGYQKKIKAVIISGYGEFELAKQALVLKVEDYLLKPLGQEEVEAVFLKLKQSLDGERQMLGQRENGRDKGQDREKEKQYSREWRAIEGLTKQLIDSIECGRFYEIDQKQEEMDRMLKHCKHQDIPAFYSYVVTAILTYFDLEQDGEIYWFVGKGEAASVLEGERQPERLREQLSQDMEHIRKALWSHSDRMWSLLAAKARSMIEAEYGDENLSLVSVANRLNISYGYLSTIFTKAEGHSFKTHLVMVRMEKARLLLLSRNYRIYEIAQMTGYKNPRYFTDAFRKYYHCSPADYIARFRGKEEEK